MEIVSLLWLLPAFLVSFLGSLIAFLEAALLNDWASMGVCSISLCMYGVFIALAVTGWVLYASTWYVTVAFLLTYAFSAIWAWIGYSASQKTVVREAYENVSIAVQLGGIVVQEKTKQLFAKLRDKLPKKSHEAPNTPPQKASLATDVA